MAKAGAKMSGMRKVVVKVKHNPHIRTNIPAGLAMVGPPLGPMLGQHGLNIAVFCKDFNARTAHYKEGIPLPCRIHVKPDRSYDMHVNLPTSSYFLKQAAGIQRGAMVSRDEVAGKITLKHVYEIATIKINDPNMALTPLQQLCEMIIGQARTLGIQVVRNLDAAEYGEFLEQRKILIEQQLLEIREKREAKLLRK